MARVGQGDWSATLARAAALSLWAVGLALLMAAALERVRLTAEYRALHADLGRIQARHDELMVEHSRLLLERGAESAFDSVEHAAATELGMVFPEQVEHLAP